MPFLDLTMPIPMPAITSFKELAAFGERWKFPAPSAASAEWFDAEKLLKLSGDQAVVGVAVE